ncbi:MAG: hypothetical protein QW039_01710 [Fervidicoccaceae archaeon]
MIEGFIGRLKSSYWIARTYYDISGKRLVIPRYLEKMGSLTAIKEAEESISIAEKILPTGLELSECFGRLVPLLFPSSFDEILDPRSGPKIKSDKVAMRALELMKRLRDLSGSEDIGVTGGLLVGKRTEDIDIVVYGRRTCEQIYGILERENLLEKYSEREAFELLIKRGQKPITMELIDREARKRLQGKYRGIDVYIRLIPAIPEKPLECQRKVRKIGEVERKVKILDARANYLYPCKYIAEEISTGARISIQSDRGRFCELFEEDEIALVKGELEVVSEENKNELSIYLWRKEHFMIPFRKVV